MTFGGVRGTCVALGLLVSAGMSASAWAKPNLKINDITATVSGGTITFTVMVENDGDAYSGTFSIDFYPGATTPPGPSAFGPIFADGLPSVPPGTVAAREVGGSASLPISTCYAKVDSYGGDPTFHLVDESNESDNVAGSFAVSSTGTITGSKSSGGSGSGGTPPPPPPPGGTSGANLIIEEFSYTSTATELTGKVVVKNVGTAPTTTSTAVAGAPADTFAVGYFAGDPTSPDAPFLGAGGVLHLAPGASFEALFTADASTLPPEGVDLWTMVDAGEWVVESNESDNILGPLKLKASSTGSLKSSSSGGSGGGSSGGGGGVSSPASKSGSDKGGGRGRHDSCFVSASSQSGSSLFVLAFALALAGMFWAMGLRRQAAA